MDPIIGDEEYLPQPNQTPSYTEYLLARSDHYVRIRQKYEVPTLEQLTAPKPDTSHNPRHPVPEAPVKQLELVPELLVPLVWETILPPDISEV